MSIGYKKEGYATAVEVKKGETLAQNISYGVLPVEITLPSGFHTYIVRKDSPLLNKINVDTSTLTDGQSLSIEIKVQNNGK